MAQTVFAALATNLSRLRDPRAIAAWLARSARRESWRVRKERARAAGLAPDPPALAADADAELLRVEEHHALRAALDELGGRCRELIRELYFRSPAPGYEEIAARLGVPIGSIGPTRRRCLEKLAELIESRGRAGGAGRGGGD